MHGSITTRSCGVAKHHVLFLKLCTSIRFGPKVYMINLLCSRFQLHGKVVMPRILNKTGAWQHMPDDRKLLIINSMVRGPTSCATPD